MKSKTIRFELMKMPEAGESGGVDTKFSGVCYFPFVKALLAKDRIAWGHLAGGWRRSKNCGIVFFAFKEGAEQPELL